MPTKKTTEKQHQDTLLAWAAAGYSTRGASTNLSVARSTFQSRLRLAKQWVMDTAAAQTWAKRNGIMIEGVTDKEPENIEIHNKVLQDQIKKLQSKIDRLESNDITHEEVRKTILELGNHNPKEPEWTNDRQQFPYHHGIPTLMLSDIHMGEVVNPKEVFFLNEFNTEICIQRIKNVTDRTIYLTKEVLNDPEFPGACLVLGGDMINGVIHEELHIGSDRMIMDQILEIADALHAVILKLLRVFPRLFVVGVPGNHGRVTRKVFQKFNAAHNADWLTYQLLERYTVALQAQGKLQFFVPPARDVTYTLAGRKFRLTHGDQFRGGDGVIGFLGPTTRGMKKKQAMALSMPHDEEHFDTLLMGHFHSLHMTGKMIINGSIKGLDEYAVGSNFEYEPPQQALFLTHERYGINHFIPVLADEPGEHQTKPEWVTWQANTGSNTLTKFKDMLGWADDV